MRRKWKPLGELVGGNGDSIRLGLTFILTHFLDQPG
jgi:hypothetical protein